MKVITSTGLVPVKALVRFSHKKAGSVFGIEPKFVLAALQEKQVELAEIPEGVDTFDLDIGVPTIGDALVELEEDGEVLIPEDWESLHGVKQISIAKAIVGGELVVPEDSKPGIVAKEVIKTELERRAAAAAAAAGNNQTPAA